MNIESDRYMANLTQCAMQFEYVLYDHAATDCLYVIMEIADVMWVHCAIDVDIINAHTHFKG